jgi:Short C-terminal domain
LQFTIPDGNESRGGILAATGDENTFMFTRGNNSMAPEIKSYIERAIYARRDTAVQRPSSVADELRKLAGLRSEGVISDAEFEAAKTKLLG